jgi:uncharacterized damage-inducible protein DinB
MMQLAEMRVLFDYDAWATSKILDQAEQLEPEQYSEPAGPGAQSIGQILTHMLIARHLWRMRLETGKSDLRIRPDDFPTLASYRTGWDDERQSFDAFLAALDDAALGQPVRFERRGEIHAYTLWHILFQLISHNAQHRAEIAERLTAYGYSPSDLDFFLFVAAVE